jgi:hypothetical protein
VEQQPWDSDAKTGLVFNLQLQQAIVMYFLCQGKSVRVLSASERYKFLEIENWQQMTRHFRKVSTATAVRRVLEPKDDNLFARRNHDLRMWQAAGENQHDMADALGQVLCYFYRNKDAVAAGRVVEAEITNRLVAPEQLGASSAQQQQQQQASLRYNRSSGGSGGAGPSHKKAKHDSAARHIHAKALLQQTLTKLQAEHLERVHFRDSRTESLSDRLRNGIRCVSELFTQLQLPRNCINAVVRIIQFHSGLTDGRPNDPPDDAYHKTDRRLNP